MLNAILMKFGRRCEETSIVKVATKEILISKGNAKSREMLEHNCGNLDASIATAREGRSTFCCRARDVLIWALRERRKSASSQYATDSQSEDFR